MEHKESSYDLVVCGGGIQAFCAAITAARAGVNVALIENRPILGGNGSSLALVPPHGAASFWHNRMAREGGILEEVMIEYAARSPRADNRRIFDMILKEWCGREPNLDLYFNTRVDDVETENDRIQSVSVTQHSTETGFRLSGRCCSSMRPVMPLSQKQPERSFESVGRGMMNLVSIWHLRWAIPRPCPLRLSHRTPAGKTDALYAAGLDLQA